MFPLLLIIQDVSPEVVMGILLVLVTIYFHWRRMRSLGELPVITTTDYSIIERQCNPKLSKCLKDSQNENMLNSEEVYDVVVVGGGCAGATAAKTANSLGLKVLLIEEGDKEVGSMVLAPSYTHELIGSKIDTGSRSGVPLAGIYGSKDECMSHSSKMNDNKSGQLNPVGPGERMLRYPRGKGLGGTSNLDWAVSFTSIFSMYRKVPPEQHPEEVNTINDPNKRACSVNKKNKSFFCYKGDIESMSGASGHEIHLSDATFKNPISWAFERSVTKVLNIMNTRTDANNAAQIKLPVSNVSLRQDDTSHNDDATTPVLSFEARRLPVVGKAVSALLRVAQFTDIRVSPVGELLSSKCSVSQSKDNGHLLGFSVLVNCRVVEIIYEDNKGPSDCSTNRQKKGEKKVIGVRIEHLKEGNKKSKNMSSIVVRPRKGVILCAGVFGTPRLLRPSLAPAHTDSSPSINDAITGFCDSIGFPVIYEARPGLSDDVHNVHNMISILSWALTRKGPVTHVVSNSMVVIDVPRHPGAQVLIQMLPHGGYNRSRFLALGLPPSLGVFKEAFTFYISIYKLANHINLSKSQIEGVSVESRNKGTLTERNVDIYLDGLGLVNLSTRSCHNDIVKPHCAFPSIKDTNGQSSNLNIIILDCLEYGFSFVRDVVQQSPLSSITTGREALDTLLFSKDDGLRVYRALYGTSPSARQVQEKQKGELELCKKIAIETALSTIYMRNYIAKHCRYMGYGSGTSWSFLEKTSDLRIKMNEGGAEKNKRGSFYPSVMDPASMSFSHRVAFTSNLYVGDVSCVPPYIAFKYGFQNSGGVETTMDCGRRAAIELAGTL